MSMREWFRQRHDLSFLSRFAGKWLLPILFYGLGLGTLVPLFRYDISVGWRNRGLGEDTQWDSTTVTEVTTCQTIDYADGTVSDTCQDIVSTETIDFFEVDFSETSSFLLPIRLIVGMVFLAIAYKRTPKLE